MAEGWNTYYLYSVQNATSLSGLYFGTPLPRLRVIAAQDQRQDKTDAVHARVPVIAGRKPDMASHHVVDKPLTRDDQ
jgi:hypothetical protein